MSVAEDLTATLRQPEVEDTEFLRVLADLYGPGGMWPDGSVVYPSSLDYMLKIRTDDVHIESIESGPKFTSADLDKIEAAVRSKLIESSGTTVALGTIFSSPHPVVGAFRHGTIQILPAPAGAPEPPFAHSSHSFLIEFALRQSSDQGITNARRMRGIVEWSWLLNLFLRSGVRFINPRSRHMWALVAGPADFSRVRYVQEGYPDFGGYRPGFSPAGPDEIMVVPHDEYYSESWYPPPDKGVIVPDSFPRLIDRLNGLPRGNRRLFMRAAQWFYASREVSEHNRSLAYQALASAIECMTPVGPRNPCPTCGMDLSPGPTRRFNGFLNRYAPPPVGKKRPPFFGTRSGLTHGSLLLYLDELPWVYHSGVRSIKEMIEHGEFWHSARCALVNWLLKF
jgi:hypothetical protein